MKFYQTKKLANYIRLKNSKHVSASSYMELYYQIQDTKIEIVQITLLYKIKKIIIFCRYFF